MRTVVLVLLWALAAPVHAGEKLSGSNVDVRTTLTFKVSDTAVQKLVPPGWAISPPPAGPSKGFNVAVVLVDSFSAFDAEGKPAAPLRGAALVIPAKKSGTDATVSMVFFGIMVPEGAPGSYGVYVPGKVAIERKVASGADGKLSAEESWDFSSADGSAIQALIHYTRGTAAKAKVEAKVHAAAKPEFYRIYRWDQVAEVVRSTATGVDRVTKFSFKASGPVLGPLFDGSEQLISVTSVPSYSRMVFLPD